MKKTIFLLVAFFTLSNVAIAYIADKTTLTYVKESTVTLTIEDYLQTYGELYGVDPNILYAVMMCESRGNPKSIGDGGRSKSYFQYMDETWNRYTKKYQETFGVTDTFDLYSIHDNAKLTAFVFSLGESSRNEWTCYRALARGGKYTFYSRINDKWFTVYCDPEKYGVKL